MKLYTKTGDDGTTALFGGRRVSKHDMRIQAYGTVDELNAFVGSLIASISDNEVEVFLRAIQSRLFDIGSHLATVPGKNVALPKIDDTLIQDLEEAIDKMQMAIPELRHFILPGSGESNARAHICRTVCRRAERLTVSLVEIEEVDSIVISYLNRLSDYFFSLSRYLTYATQEKEIKWIPIKEK